MQPLVPPHHTAPLTLPEPYYSDDWVTLYCGDARDIVPFISVETIITDPVWPNSIFPEVLDPCGLLAQVLTAASPERIVVHLGCDSDPRFLSSVPVRFPFVRSCLLEYARPSYKGRLVYGGDIAYIYGTMPPPVNREGKRGAALIPGLCISTRSDAIFRRSNWNGSEKRFQRDRGSAIPHPAPRRLQHVQWLVKWFAGASVLDPFAGSGTTLLACKSMGIPCIGIEIKKQYCDLAIERLRQEVLF